jgi:hypothetical protein
MGKRVEEVLAPMAEKRVLAGVITSHSSEFPIRKWITVTAECALMVKALAIWPWLVIGTLVGTALLITLPIGAAIWWITLFLSRSSARLEVRQLPTIQEGSLLADNHAAPLSFPNESYGCRAELPPHFLSRKGAVQPFKSDISHVRVSSRDPMGNEIREMLLRHGRCFSSCALAVC